MSHYMFHKEVMDHVAGRTEVFPFENWAEVFYDRKACLLSESFIHNISCFPVPGKDNRKVISGAKPGLRVSGTDQFRKFCHVGDGPPVNPSRKEDHIGSEFSNSFYSLMRKPPII